MGLLDSVLGAVLGGQQNNQQQAGAGGMNLTALLPVLMPIVTSMLANNGSQGGLGGLASKFNQAGMGDVMNSWIGTGQNQPINGDQLTQVLGNDTMGQIASQLGMGNGDAAGALSQILPGLIDQLTPQGQAPAGGLGNADDLMGMLGGLLAKR
ncbi:MAG: DUF937 domain-containing protein [Betaproteobacteria bacterium]|jgi:uncharacterized protein YidB (DUF937 family)|nr:DUF937 domain-containing protein [Betaproteobacteria bacterium]MBK7656148.1 DUF937 domain-containing protein [Betaproteobacteria bacterium]MBP6644843.1 DUF937 domain-containing protein [Burkholderiaceae bacterium]